MVQAVENWCCVAGTVESVDPPPPQSKGKPDQVALTIRVARVTSVADYPSLLHAEDLPRVAVILRRSQLGDLQAVGRRVTMPVRVAGPDRCFVHPDWSLVRGSAMCGPN